jgi:hypothetical protein
MDISTQLNVSNYHSSKPTGPTPPPSGNIENRQPPSEPEPPTTPKSSSATETLGSRIDIMA